MGRFLVTGGAGFIGSHIVERLLREGNFVRVLDNFSSGKEKNLAYTQGLPATSYELIRADIRDVTACRAACEGIDYVLHQAALRSVPKSLIDPYAYNSVNIDGTLNMLKAAHEKGVKRFVLASSSSVYGDTDVFPEKETDYPKLISPYALTKLAGEYYCRIYSTIYGLATVSLRYFNVFGPRQAVDDEYAVVIPKFITCMRKGQQPPIFGTGRQSRDFTYVDNVVEANILSAVTSGIQCEVFNVANGKDHSVLELVDTINKILGLHIKPLFLDKRPGDVYKTLADVRRARKIVGLRTKVDFVEGLQRTVEYFKNVSA
ncbi:MAG: SDR family oxidoreductase [Candidatus Omnitrophica bacterium]|nr:SDR family oxidoreductase [Candidatus Omnitrophota bacterium]